MTTQHSRTGARPARTSRYCVSALAALLAATAPAAAQLPSDVQSAPAAATPVSTAARREMPRLQVTLSARTLELWIGDSLAASYDVAVGAPGHDTPSGAFTIDRLIWNPRWVPPEAAWASNASPKAPGDPDNPMKVVKIFFREPDYYIHGTGAEQSVGTAASHGCLRMRPDDAAELARRLMALGGADRPDEWFARVRAGDREQEVRLAEPVPIQVVP